MKLRNNWFTVTAKRDDIFAAVETIARALWEICIVEGFKKE